MIYSTIRGGKTEDLQIQRSPVAPKPASPRPQRAERIPLARVAPGIPVTTTAPPLRTASGRSGGKQLQATAAANLHHGGPAPAKRHGAGGPAHPPSNWLLILPGPPGGCSSERLAHKCGRCEGRPSGESSLSGLSLPPVGPAGSWQRWCAQRISTSAPARLLLPCGDTSPLSSGHSSSRRTAPAANAEFGPKGSWRWWQSWSRNLLSTSVDTAHGVFGVGTPKNEQGFLPRCRRRLQTLSGWLPLSTYLTDRKTISEKWNNLPRSHSS